VSFSSEIINKLDSRPLSIFCDLCYNLLSVRAMGNRWAEVLRFIGIGWYIAACIALGILGGHWLGQKLDGSSCEVIFTLLGLILGLIVAFLGVYRMYKAIEGNNQDAGKGNS